MKILCMCQRGNTRSAALAYLLKDFYGHDAIAAGWQSNGFEIRKVLSDWADVVIVMQPDMVVCVDEPNRNKVRVLDVGPDTYLHSRDPVLLEKLQVMIQREY